MTRRVWSAGLWLGLTAALLATAYLLINTTFMFYDDEGYLLLTYRNFLAGARLYDDVFTQYGPWPYVYHQLVTSLLHQPMTHMLGRDLTALHWVWCAVGCGLIAGRVTGRTVTGLSTAVITFGLLWQMDSEPSHPGSLISVLLATAALTALILHENARWNWLGAMLGGIAALLVLTKINVGLLFVAGVGVGALRLTNWPERGQRVAGILAAAGLLAVPWGLMGRKLADPFVLTFAVQFTVAAAGLLWVTPLARTGRTVPPRTWAVAVGVFILTIVVVTAAVCLQGTTLAALVQTVLFDPLRHPGKFMLGFTWPPALWPIAITCWVTTGWAGWKLRQQGEVDGLVRTAVIAVRLGALAVFVSQAMTWLTIYGVGRFIAFSLPLLPVFLVPLGAAKTAWPDRTSGRFWLAALALPQVLHAFPVAGSQMGWGTFLLVPVMIIGLDEAWNALDLRWPATRRWLPRVGWGTLLVVSGWQLGELARTGWERYASSQPLDLPGAGDIRMSGPARLTTRVLTINAAVHSNVLFSRPGMFSYNLWSGVPTPTAQNATHWFWLLDDSAQSRIIGKLRATPRSAIITNQDLDEYLVRIKVPTASPLQSYIQDSYRLLFEHRRFQFMVPLASRAVPFQLVDLRGLESAQAGDKSPALLRTNIVLDGEPATIQLRGTAAPWAIVLNYSQPGTRIYLEPITPQGDTIGPALAWPVGRALHGLYRLSVFAAEAPRLAQPQDAVLTVQAPDGAVLSESIF